MIFRKFIFQCHTVTVRPRPSPSHIYFWHMHYNTPWMSDQAHRKASAWDNTTYKDKEQASMPEVRSEPAISATRRPRPSLRWHGHRDRHKHDLNCLLKLLPACIHFGCNFCPQFQYYISLITACNKSYYGVLCMRDFRADRLKNERHHSSSDQWAGKRPDWFQLGFTLRTMI
jgi:hypothetical protein